MSDMVERAAKAICAAGGGDRWNNYLDEARAAIAIVIEDCALVAEDEFLLDAHGEPDHSAHNWAVERIVERIRAAPEDSKAQSDIEKLAAVTS